MTDTGAKKAEVADPGSMAGAASSDTEIDWSTVFTAMNSPDLRAAFLTAQPDVAFMHMDRAGRVLDVWAGKSHWERIGADPAIFVGMTLPEIFPKEAARHLQESVVDEVMRTGEQLSGIHRFPEKWVGEAWFEYTAFAVRDEDGVPLSIALVLRDTTDRVRAERSYGTHLELLRTINAISTEFLRLPPDEIDDGIVRALALLGAFSGADRVCVFRFREGGEKMDNSHEWCAPGIEPRKDQLQGLSVAEFEWSQSKIREGNRLQVDRVTNLPDDADRDRTFADGFGVRSYLFVPMTYGDRVLGSVGFVSVRTERTWMEEEVSLLSTVADVIGIAVQKAEVERSVRASEAQFRLLFENARDAIFWAEGESGRIVNCNQAAEKLTGRSREQIIGLHQSELHPAEDRPRYGKIFAAHADASGVLDQPAEVLTASGERVPVVIAGSTATVGDRHIVQGVFRDVSEGVKAREALRTSVDTARALVNASPDMAVLVDRDGIVIDANDRAARGVGQTRETLVGSYAFDWFPEPVAERRCATVQRLVASGESFESEDEWNGRYFYNRLQPVLDESGEVILLAIFSRDITERRREQKALAENEKLYRLLAENVRDVIWTADLDLNYTYVTPSVADLSGYSPAELIGKNLLESVSIDSAPVVREVAAREIERVESGNLSPAYTTTVELQLKKKGGGATWAEAKVSWLRDADGNPAGLLGVTRDMTERKVTENALRESESKSRALLRAVPDMMFRYARDGRIIEYYASDHEELYVPPEQFLGKKIDEVLPSELGARFRHLMTEAFRTGHVQRIEYELEVPRGLRSYEARMVVCDVDDVLVIVRDITESRATEAAIRESESKYRNLVETASDGICIVQDGIVAYANEQLCQFMKEPATSLVGREFSYYIHPDYREQLGEYYLRHMSGARDLGIIEVRVGPPPDYAVEVEINTSIVLLGGREAELVVVRDVTERNRIDREKTHLEEQLRQSQKLEAIGQLAGGIAHDFNNLLMGVCGGASVLLRRVPPDSKEHEVSGRIARAANHMADLTDQLLTFARGGEHNPTPNDLNRIVNESLRLLPSTIRKRMAIETDFAFGLPPVEVDRVQITQVAMNLFQNAYEAMNAKGRLIIQTSVTPPDELPTVLADLGIEFATLVVDDTGPGVSPEVREQIFDPFFTTKRYGRGLGLSAVYGIVKNHGGLITCEEAPTGGARFAVYLPLSDTASLSESKRRGAGENGDERSATILVVDDDEMSREMTASMLGTLGHVVETADGGFEAVDTIRRAPERFDAVLLDVVMPDIDGAETFRRLMKIRPHLPVLFFSGYHDQVIVDEDIKALAAGFLKKPFDLRKLGEAIQCCLKSGSSRST